MTLKELGSQLDRYRKLQGLKKMEFASKSGLHPRTLQHILQGDADYQITGLLAVVDRLGLELILVPKEISSGSKTEGVIVKSLVDLAMEPKDKS